MFKGVKEYRSRILLAGSGREAPAAVNMAEAARRLNLLFLAGFFLASTMAAGCIAPAAQSAGLKDILPASIRKGEATHASIRDKWALLISCTSYQDQGIKGNGCSAANLEALSALLVDPQYGRFAADHVRAVSGGAAGRAGIEDAVNNWLVKKALPGDLVLVYLCSASTACPNGEPVALVFDSVAEQPWQSGISLKDLLTDVKRRIQSPYILCLLDLSAIQSEEAGAKEPSIQSLYGAGVSILSSSNLVEPSKTSSALGVSLFVKHFIAAEHVGGGSVPLSLVADYVIANVGEDARKLPGKSQNALFFTPPENSLLSQVALGQPVKSSLPPLTYSLGHPVEKLAISRPDIIPPRQTTARASADSSLRSGRHPPQPATGCVRAMAPPAVKPAAVEADDEEEEPTAPVDFGSYMKGMKEDIQKNWHPPKGLENRHIVAVFTIKRDGTIINPSLVEASGIDDLDRSALDALKSASPLPPLPSGAPSSVDIRYRFDWKLRQQ